MNRKRLALLFGGILVGMLVGAGVIYASTRLTARPPAAQVAVGALAPDFLLTSTAGKQVKLSEARGRPVLLNFWATWCPPCKQEMPLLQQTAEAYPDLAVLAVNNDEAAEVAAGFAQANHLTFTILLDPGGAVNTLYQLRGYPTSYFIDSAGILRAIHIGQLTEAALNSYLTTIGVHVK